MRLLLDTQVLIGIFVEKTPAAGTPAHAALTNPEHDPFVSLVSVWEVAIKHALPGKRSGAMPFAPREFLRLSLEAGMTLLPITPEHVFALQGLPPRHGDPFDRLLVAQAVAEGMLLVTRDKLLASYSDLAILV